MGITLRYTKLVKLVKSIEIKLSFFHRRRYIWRGGIIMGQKVEVDRTHGTLREFGEIFVYAIVFTFVLEGLFFFCFLIYSLVFYRFVAWIQWKGYIGLVITYTIFIVGLIVMLHILHRLLKFSKRSFLRGFTGALAFYSILFPLTPISWYIVRLSSQGLSQGVNYGFQYQLWPLLTLVGLSALAVLIMDFHSNSNNDSQQYKSMLLFSGVLAVLTSLVSMLALAVPPDTGPVDTWATPFFILPHVAGLALLLESVSQFIEVRNCAKDENNHSG